jgi:hypothetical protein
MNPSPAEELLYAMFQEARDFVYGLRDHDCEDCGEGAMAIRVIMGDKLYWICGNCKHVSWEDYKK